MRRRIIKEFWQAGRGFLISSGWMGYDKED